MESPQSKQPSHGTSSVDSQSPDTQQVTSPSNMKRIGEEFGMDQLSHCSHPSQAGSKTSALTWGVLAQQSMMQMQAHHVQPGDQVTQSKFVQAAQLPIPSAPPAPVPVHPQARKTTAAGKADRICPICENLSVLHGAMHLGPRSANSSARCKTHDGDHHVM